MATLTKKTKAIKRKVNKDAARNLEAYRRRVPQPEAPDWGEPIAEAPEARVAEGREAPDAGYGEPYSDD